MINFFDIDGTLMERDETLRDSTREALSRARQNGHQVCLATGRAKGGIPAVVEEVEWDGYVLGNGTYGEYQGDLVTYECLNQEHLAAFREYTRDLEGLGLVYESHPGSYMTEADGRAAYEVLRHSDFFRQFSLSQFLGFFDVVEDIETINEVSKIMYFGGGRYAQEMISRFQDHFDFLPNSVVQARSYDDGEIMKKGISKATAIAKVIDRAGYDRADVIAFGDGYNDIEMIRYAGTGVAMGNGVDDLKKEADLVTAGQQQEGIYKALKELNLI